MSRPNWRIALAALAVLLTAADTYVVVLALPDMMRSVGLDADQLGRAAPIISIFLLGYVAMLPTVGRLADIVGRPPVLMGCLLVFSFGCLVTTTAHTLPSVVVGRGLQGLGAGGLVPVTLALVADAYPPERRAVPLGAVGAAQEAGALLGPLYGALVLSVSGWRTIFWVNLAAGLVLAVVQTGKRVPRVDWLGAVCGLGALAGVVLLLVAPSSIVNDYTYGVLYEPVAGGGRATSPIAMATALVGLVAVIRLTNRARLVAVLRALDLPGALLAAIALGCLVLALSVSDPQRHAIATHGGYLIAAAAIAVALFVVRQLRSAHPLIPPRAFADRSAYGGLITSALVGVALIAALVDIPVIGRVTGRDQLGAALLLVQLLAAVPVGALLGGRTTQAFGPRWTAGVGAFLAGGGLALMTQWHAASLHGGRPTAALVLAGLGFGLTVAPINTAVLNATPDALHGLASALVVVARTVGMLVGLSALTAIGLSRFAHAAAHVGSPLDLCPSSPTHCSAYDAAIRSAAISETHAVFAGAAIAAAAAAVLGGILLRPRVGAPARPVVAGAPT